MDTDLERGKLDGLMVIMASLSHGLEQVLGRGAATVTFRAGRKIGLKSEVRDKSADLSMALEILRNELEHKGIRWPFELWKPQNASSPFYGK